MDTLISSGTAAGLIEFLDQLVERGRISSGGIVPLKSALRQILSIVDKDAWQDTDVRNLNIDDYMSRFGILTNGKYTEDSLKTYRFRFQKAITWYSTFLVQPGWAPPKTGNPRTNKNTTNETDSKKDTIASSVDSIRNNMQEAIQATDSIKTGLIAYPFPLRTDTIVKLYLPTDISLSEAKRLGRFLESLSIDDLADMVDLKD